MPMYWYDYCGGSALKAIYDAIGTRYCLPLDDFYFENNAVKTTIYGGSDVTSWVNLYAASYNGGYDLQLIGSDGKGIVSIPNGSYIECDYNESTLINDLHFFGNSSFNAFTIDVEKAIKDTAGGFAWTLAKGMGVPSKVTSNDGYFPVSYHFNVILDKLAGQTSASYDGTSNRYKFLNGSSLKIESDVELKIKELIAYKGDDIYTGRGTHAANLKKSKTPLTPANMNINGSLVADTIAGQFYGEISGGTIQASVNTSVTMYEPKKGEGDKFSAKMLNGEEGWFYLPLSLKLKNINGVIEEREPSKYNCVSNECYWEQLKELTSISIKETSGNYTSGKRAAATFNIIAEFTPIDYSDVIESFTWKQQRHDTSVSEDGYFENSTLTSTIFKTRRNENALHNNYIDVWLEVKIKGRSEILKSNIITFNAKFWAG